MKVMMMKKNITCLFLVLPVLFGFSGLASAQALGDVKIMIVDFQRVQNESLVGQDYASQANSARLAIESKEASLVTELLAEKDRLEKQRNIIAQEALKQRATELDQKAQQAEALIKQLRRDLNVAARQSTLEIQRALRPIVVKAMVDRGATMVIDKAVVYHFTGSLDVTTEIIDLLNGKITVLKTNFPEVNISS